MNNSTGKKISISAIAAISLATSSLTIANDAAQATTKRTTISDIPTSELKLIQQESVPYGEVLPTTTLDFMRGGKGTGGSCGGCH